MLVPSLDLRRDPPHRRHRPDPMLDCPLFTHKEFLLERMIGAGRMGKVYQAWQHSAGRAVAVKFLRKSFLDQPWVVQRFIGEARTIAKMRHPNIVGIHGLGRTPAGSYFIVMDLVAGSNLALVSRTRRISVPEAIHWAIETCDALEHAACQGDHPLRSQTGQSCARSRWEHPGNGLRPRALADRATAMDCRGRRHRAFMAPEQASRSYGEIDARTDIYGVGAILFTLLTGRPPWVGRRLPDILADVISAAPVIPPTCVRPDLPESVSELCRKCLSKVPATAIRRFKRFVPF